jgi:hypothetical protein
MLNDATDFDRHFRRLADLYWKLLDRSLFGSIDGPDYQGLAHWTWGAARLGWDLAEIERQIKLTDEYKRKHPVPPSSPGGIIGRLNAVSNSHYEDYGFSTPRLHLPIFCVDLWGLGRHKYHRNDSLKFLDAVANAGYDGVRTAFSLGWYDVWRNVEVNPHDFTAPNGNPVGRWFDYYTQVDSYANALVERGLKLDWTCGDLQMFNFNQISGWAEDCGAVLGAVNETLVALVEVNEVWKNWVTNTEPFPYEVEKYVIKPFMVGYKAPLIAGISAPFSGEEPLGLNMWAGDITIKHGHRGRFIGDHMTQIRRARGVNYPEAGFPAVRQSLGWETEPPGPGRGQDSPEGLCMLAVANLMAPYAFNFHSKKGGRANREGSADQPGFYEVPKVRSFLPPNLQRDYRKITHGGLSSSPFGDFENFNANRRIDSVRNGPKYVTLVYSDNGRTIIRANNNTRFTIYTPHTGEGHQFSLRRGATLGLDYHIGRVIVGEDE